MVIRGIRSDPAWNVGNYSSAPRGLIDGYVLLRMMIDGVPHLQATIPDGPAADEFIASVGAQAAKIDANDVLYSLESSADYDPEPKFGSIRTKVFALNFKDDEFNPDELNILEKMVPTLPQGKFVVQEGSESSFGHLTMAHPELWAQHVAEFMQWIGKP
jgi:homoserine O-acetyltransferase